MLENYRSLNGNLIFFNVYGMKKQKRFKNRQFLCDSGGMLEKDRSLIRGEGAERGGGVENCLLRIAYFGIAYFGIAYFEIAYFGIAYFGSKESNCLLCGRLASFE